MKLVQQTRNITYPVYTNMTYPVYTLYSIEFFLLEVKYPTSHLATTLVRCLDRANKLLPYDY